MPGRSLVLGNLTGFTQLRWSLHKVKHLTDGRRGVSGGFGLNGGSWKFGTGGLNIASSVLNGMPLKHPHQ